MAPTEMTTDVPEQRNMKPKEYWDKRARGLGGRVTSCGEENLLNLKGDRYRNENILIHEFAHAIHEIGLRRVHPKFDERLRETYQKAKDKGLWQKTYALTNHKEYWAEGVQSYFDCNAPAGGVHNEVNTREKLEKYDPDLFQLIDEVFKRSKFRYVRYDKRQQDAKKAEEKKETKSPAPDCGELVKQPRVAMRLVVQRYEADRGSLNRLYATLPDAPARHARMKRFHADWLAALRKLDADQLSEADRTKWKNLEAKVRQELLDVETQTKTQAAIAPLVPFAAGLMGLEEARRRMDKLDAVKAAGLLSATRKQIDQAAKALRDMPVTEQAASAAEAVTRLRRTVKAWFGFYNGYDPLFTWWAEQPYKDVDQALHAYAEQLRESAKAEKKVDDAAGPRAQEVTPGAADTPAAAPGNDVPDLGEMLSLPQSELTAVLLRYRNERGKRSRISALPGGADVPRSPEQTERMKQFYADWLAALEKLEFDSLSRDGRVDYLLLKNQLERELRRFDLQGKERPEARPDGSGIKGQPIGREALLNELAGEMIAYTPEELLAIADKEFAWCEAEMRKAAREMGFGDDWHKAVEKVKAMHVEPGKQPEMIRDLAREAVDYLAKHGLVTVPPLAAETWRMEMMSPQRQLINPFFTGGEVISVSFPTNTMAHEAKLQSMRGNNIPFSRATVHHELIPGHHLQGFMTARYRTQRAMFSTPFWTEGWALYWEMVLYDRGFPKSPEDRVGFLFWRMHRCARITFSLNFHLGKMSPQECIDYLVTRVGHERDNATAEVRRSFAGRDGALYQAAYMLGGLQIRALRKELVRPGGMSERAFHDAILKENRMPIAMVRAALTGQPVTRDFRSDWKFYGSVTPVN
jgi:uncharacterized protein (DUF885 family)